MNSNTTIEEEVDFTNMNKNVWGVIPITEQYHGTLTFKFQRMRDCEEEVFWIQNGKGWPLEIDTGILDVNDFLKSIETYAQALRKYIDTNN